MLTSSTDSIRVTHYRSFTTQAVNRTKQKASRERKQEYIAELEAKVRTYEQGDGERASFFQVCRYRDARFAKCILTLLSCIGTNLYRAWRRLTLTRTQL